MRAFLILVVLGGCVADAEEPTVEREVTVDVIETSALGNEMDVCGLASELPSTDVCSLICDPPAMEARMLAEGSDPNTCYQLYCALPGDQHVLVGVCL